MRSENIGRHLERTGKKYVQARDGRAPGRGKSYGKDAQRRSAKMGQRNEAEIRRSAGAKNNNPLMQ